MLTWRVKSTRVIFLFLVSGLNINFKRSQPSNPIADQNFTILRILPLIDNNRMSFYLALTNLVIDTELEF